MTAPAAMPRKVTVIGAGDIGCGWAALCASAGWPVTMFDADARATERAHTDVPARARALVAFERAPSGIVERGLLEYQQARSLLQAVTGADWVIEAITEDLLLKQRVLASIDELAAPGALITSSSSGLAPKDIFGRCVHASRCLIAHPLNPPELVPLVEIVPGPASKEAIAQADGYLRALGRVPVLVRKAVPGYAVGRISAAVWRECIDLVLNGVIAVEDLDRAMALGPALGWAAAGPHLSYHLAAGPAGVSIFLQRLLASFESWWTDLATWSQLDQERRLALIHAIQGAYGDQIEELREQRDRRLGDLLRALERARGEPGSAT
jgi:3-hydroxyacyl-CoA dehydrogenase